MGWVCVADGSWQCNHAGWQVILRPIAEGRTEFGGCWHLEIAAPAWQQQVIRWFPDAASARREAEHELNDLCASFAEAK